MTKVALVFYGITRSLRFCNESIRDKLLNPLQKEGLSYDIFLHTYTLERYSNKRTGEKRNNVDNDEYKLLQANYIQVDSQEKIKQKLNMKQYRTHKDPWNTEYNSVDNMILGLYSKKQSVIMVEKSGNNYKYVIFIRPDCLYLHELKLEFLREANKDTVVIPDFHLFGKYKMNDRFAITTMNTYKHYGCIFDHLLEISKKMSLHSETVLGLVLNLKNIEVKRVPFRFRRIRIDGTTCHSDKCIA